MSLYIKLLPRLQTQRYRGYQRNNPDVADMKLLPVLAVVALVASLSESRIVSRCELRQRLGQAIVLPRKLGPFKESIVAIISCQVERMSHLNSSLVKMHGIHLSPPTAKPAPLTTPGNNETIVDPATMEAATTMPTKTMTNKGLNNTNSSSNSSAVIQRSRQRARPNRKDMHPEMSIEEMLNEEENKFDENEMRRDDETRDGKDSREDEAMKRDTRHKHSRHTKHKKEKLPQSLSFYGIFQLSDSHFCDSGFRWSRNMCRKPCSDFTDDDITDDVECLLRSGYWSYIFRMASRQCYHERKVYFKECE